MKYLLIPLLLSFCGCAAVDLAKKDIESPKGYSYDWETGSYQKNVTYYDTRSQEAKDAEKRDQQKANEETIQKSKQYQERNLNPPKK